MIYTYLDIRITAKDGDLRTSVYRKPTYELVLIPKWSRDPIVYKKKAVFRYFFRRAVLYITDEEELKKEINYIVEVGRQQGCSKSFVSSIYNRMRKNLTLRKNNDL